MLPSQAIISSPPISVLAILTIGEVLGFWANLRIWRWTAFDRQPRRAAALRSMRFAPSGPAALVGWSGMTFMAWVFLAASHSSGTMYDITLMLAILIGGGATGVGCILSITVLLWGRPGKIMPPQLRDVPGLLSRGP